MAIKAYVAIVADPLKTKEVMRKLSAIPEVAESHEVMGPFDIIVVVGANDLEDVTPILSNHIRRIDGVVRTTSLVTFPE